MDTRCVLRAYHVLPTDAILRIQEEALVSPLIRRVRDCY